MAITIITFPPNGLTDSEPVPAQLPMIVTYNEGDASVLKMKIDFVSVITGIDVSWFQFPDPDNPLRFTFDVNKPIEDAVSFDLQAINASGQLTAVNSFKIILLNPTSYNEVDGILTELNTIVPSRIMRCLNANRQYLQDQDLEDYHVDFATTDRKFLTNAPSNKPIFINESEFLSAYTDLSATASLTILKTNRDGTTDTLNTALTLAVGGNQRWDFGVGPANINVLSPGFIDDNVVSYTVYILDGFTVYSEVRNYVIQNDCPINPIRVHFLNWLGGFDSFTFEGIGKQDIETKKTTFKKYLGGGFVNGDRGTTTLKVKGTQRITARSTPLTPEQLIWLQELLTSTEIFIVTDAGYNPVVQATRTYVIDDKVKDLQRLVVTFDYSNDLITGRS